EHQTAGGMSRFLPYLVELQPQMYCEVSPELAEDAGLEPCGLSAVPSARSPLGALDLGAERMYPIRPGDSTVHQLRVYFHLRQGHEAIVQGDGANDLIGMNLDANVQIQNSKNNSCAIRPGRRPRGPALRELVDDYRRRAGILPAEQAQVDGGGVDPVGGGPVDGFSPASVRGPLEAGAVPDNNPSMKELDNR